MSETTKSKRRVGLWATLVLGGAALLGACGGYEGDGGNGGGGGSSCSPACTDGQVCNTATYVCVDCLGDDDCDGTETCNLDTYTCEA